MTNIVHFLVGAALIGCVYFVAVCLVQIGYDVVARWRNR